MEKTFKANGVSCKIVVKLNASTTVSRYKEHQVRVNLHEVQLYIVGMLEASRTAEDHELESAIMDMNLTAELRTGLNSVDNAVIEKLKALGFN